MKICIIGNPNSPHLLRWVEYFVKRGYTISLIGNRPRYRPIPDGVDFYDLSARFNIRKIRYLFWAWEVYHIIWKIRPDILHSFSLSGASWLGNASHYHPFLTTAHGSDLYLLPHRTWLHRYLTLSALRAADCVMCVSTGLMQQARKYGISIKKIKLIYLGVDVDIFHPSSAKTVIRKRLGLDPKRPIILSLRPIRKIYNTLNIAHAIPLVCRRIPSALFLIFTFNSTPSMLAQFRSLISEYGVSEHVKFIGEISNDMIIADYYRAADIAVSLSLSDGTPKSVQEAMACGTPVIVSDIPAIHEWVHHKHNGLLIPPNDIEALADAIISLLTDRELREYIGKRGAEIIRERADMKFWMKQAEDLYKNLV